MHLAINETLTRLRIICRCERRKVHQPAIHSHRRLQNYGHNQVCEVAHIKPFYESNPEEKYDPNNGILLSADLHKLFDLKLLTINPDTFQLRLTDSVLLDEEFKDYYQYNGKNLEIKSESKKYFNKLSELSETFKSNFSN